MYINVPFAYQNIEIKPKDHLPGQPLFLSLADDLHELRITIALTGLNYYRDVKVLSFLSILAKYPQAYLRRFGDIFF